MIVKSRFELRFDSEAMVSSNYNISTKSGSLSSEYPTYLSYFPLALSLFTFAQYNTFASTLFEISAQKILPFFEFRVGEGERSSQKPS